MTDRYPYHQLVLPNRGPSFEDTQHQENNQVLERAFNLLEPPGPPGQTWNIIRVSINSDAFGWTFGGEVAVGLGNGMWSANIEGYGQPANIFMSFPTWTFTAGRVVTEGVFLDNFDSFETAIVNIGIVVWQSSAPLANYMSLYAHPAATLAPHAQTDVDLAGFTVFNSGGADLVLTGGRLETSGGLDYAATLQLFCEAP